MQMKQRLIVATSNPGKLLEMQAYLSDSSWELTLKPPELDVDEVGETFAANACLKASEVAMAMNCWAIADDSGLRVNALGGAPGIYSARYGTSDQDRIDRLLRELGDKSDRQAQFICAVAVARPDGSIVPKGEGGFGYDPIFYVPEVQLTFAEMPKETKRKIGHRGRAFDLINAQLVAIE
jgi:XTP/dITP diphosphohydrolase